MGTCHTLFGVLKIIFFKIHFIFNNSIVHAPGLYASPSNLSFCNANAWVNSVPAAGAEVVLPTNLVQYDILVDVNTVELLSSIQFGDNAFLAFGGNNAFVYFGLSSPNVPCNCACNTSATTKPASTTSTTSSHAGAASVGGGSTSVIGPIIGAVAGVILVLLIVLIVLRRRSTRRPAIKTTGSTSTHPTNDAAEVKPAFVNVKEMIAQSAFGVVYRGELKVCPQYRLVRS